jgi:predicted kinase
MEKIIIICRGIPGAGKSTFAHTLSKAVCCADDYFANGDEYRWFDDKIDIAHAWCERKCERFMKIGISKIVVANTSTTQKEMQPYFNLAKQYGYKTFSIIVENRHGNKSVHNVPEESLQKMRDRFEVQI